MRIFCLDFHIGPVSDFKRILAEIRPDTEFVIWNLSFHTWVLGESPANVDVIRGAQDWFTFDSNMIQRFQERYDSFLSGFDAFFVAHAFSMLMVYEKYNKPVYCWNTCRYDLPFNFIHKNPSMLEPYNACIRRLHESGHLRGFANNLGDQAYFRLGTGVMLPLLPSLGEYAGIVHSPTTNRFLWYSDRPMPLMIPNYLAPKQRGFTWKSLGAYRGIIHIPYEISTMSLFEHYASGIPIFVPSKSFLKQMWVSGVPWQSMCAYWGSSAPACFSECQQMDFWIDRADFYNPEWMSYVYTFNSFHHLQQLLRTFQDPWYSDRMAFIQTRRNRILEGWKTCLRGVGELAQ